jgi:hypothetical protein
MVNFELYKKTTEPLYKMSEIELKLFLIYLLTSLSNNVTDEQWEESFNDAKKVAEVEL